MSMYVCMYVLMHFYVDKHMLWNDRNFQVDAYFCLSGLWETVGPSAAGSGWS